MKNPAKWRYVTFVSVFIKILVWGSGKILILGCDKISCWGWLAVIKYRVGVGWAVTKYKVEVGWAVTKH